MNVSRIVKNYVRNKINIYEHVYDYVYNKNIKEGIYSSELDNNVFRSDLMYYAFDWDDNIMYMPTKIMVLSENEEEVPMSTEDFAEHRQQIGVEPFNYKGTTVVGFAPNPFRYFREEGDKYFIIDSMSAPLGPAWNDFVECINGGSIFAIITARGHNPQVLRDAIFNLIISNKNGLNRKKLEESLRNYDLLKTTQLREDDEEDNRFTEISDYLDMCKFHPVSFGSGSAASPEEGKNKALKEFISYCKEQAKELITYILENNPNLTLKDLTPKFKNNVTNEEMIDYIDLDEFINKNIKIGFSDDDERNIKASSEFLNKEFEKNPVNLYLTKGGSKSKYE